MIHRIRTTDSTQNRENSTMASDFNFDKKEIVFAAFYVTLKCDFLNHLGIEINVVEFMTVLKVPSLFDLT